MRRETVVLVDYDNTYSYICISNWNLIKVLGVEVQKPGGEEKREGGRQKTKTKIKSKIKTRAVSIQRQQKGEAGYELKRQGKANKMKVG